MSEKLLLRPSALELCPFLWLNLMLRRGLAILSVSVFEDELDYPFSSAGLDAVQDLDCQGGGASYGRRAVMELMQVSRECSGGADLDRSELEEELGAELSWWWWWELAAEVVQSSLKVAG